MLVDDKGQLTGIFTDSDLAKLLEQKQEKTLDDQVANVMTRNPITVDVDVMMDEAVEILATRRISELPVVDTCGRPLGMLDITDAIEWCPRPAPSLEGDEINSSPEMGDHGTIPFQSS